MANLFSQYTSGMQFTAGTIAGSSLGVSGLNPLVDRLNSVAPSDSLLSGNALLIYGNTHLVQGNGISITNTSGIAIGSLISGTSLNIVTPYQAGNSWTGSFISGTSQIFIGSVINSRLISGASLNIISPYQNGNTWTGSMVSGTNHLFIGSKVISSVFSGTNAYIGTANIGTLTATTGSFTDEVIFAAPVHLNDTIDTTNNIYLFGNNRSIQIYSGLITFATAGSIQSEKAMFRLENRTSDPANPSIGRIWIRTDL